MSCTSSEVMTISPETIESLFLAYRLTGDQRYRDYGWAIFQSIEKYCRIESGGYASVLDVNSIPVTHENKMETFLMVSDGFRTSKTSRLNWTQSETLKYLYLLFEDATVLPLDSRSFSMPLCTSLILVIQNTSLIQRCDVLFLLRCNGV